MPTVEDDVPQKIVECRLECHVPPETEADRLEMLMGLELLKGFGKYQCRAGHRRGIAELRRRGRCAAVESR